MHASSAVRLSIEIRVKGTDIYASHCRVVRVSSVVGSIAEEDYWALAYAFPGRVISVGVVVHRTDLHTKTGVVISEVRNRAAGCSVGLVIHAFLGQRISVAIVDAWT